jgi:hypothetical protein
MKPTFGCDEEPDEGRKFITRLQPRVTASSVAETRQPEASNVIPHFGVVLLLKGER